MKLSLKLYLSFGAVLFITTVVTVFSYVGLERAEQVIFRFNELSYISNKSAALESEVLSMRMSMKNYLINNEEKHLDEFEQGFLMVDKHIDSLENAIDKKERLDILKAIDSQVENYKKSFDNVVTLVEDRHSIFKDQLVPSGAKMMSTIDELIHLAYEGSNDIVMLRAAQLQKDLLIGRFHIATFLNSNSEEDYELALSLSLIHI